MKKAKLLLATLTMSVVLSMTALAGEWKHDSKGWWYRNDDGTYPTSSWVADGKDWYYVDAEGTMQTEDLVDGQITYHFDESGKCTNPFGNTIYNADGSIDYSNWVPTSYGSIEGFIDDVENGNVVCINGQYYTSPEYNNMISNEEIVYEHDVAPEPLKNRFGLADMQF
ncbi:MULTISPECIES: hypothetical protein [Enterocloster]|uniref:hypothetical protein n=1 Tax=Enterocloster TaxID=2719313 RepID=UPI002665D246|nr:MULTISPECIES: hypothetical protein [Enterocloster]MDR3758264.1 hypothetical protein [Enterocloster sp.]